ncbi:hypothetical protein Taro_056508, partial [Colocasia esculenta]|nr:hypothetical protein [Colocasia esculenta]
MATRGRSGAGLTWGDESAGGSQTPAQQAQDQTGVPLPSPPPPVDYGALMQGLVHAMFTHFCHSGVDTVHLCVDTTSLSQKPVLKQSCDPYFEEKVQGSEGQSLKRALMFRAREQI